MLQRIFNKALSITNTLLWKLHAFFEKAGWLKPVPFTFFIHKANAVVVSHKMPVNFDPKDQPLFDHYTNYKTFDEQLLEFKNVNVSRPGVVFKGFNNAGLALPHPVFRARFGWLYLLGQYATKRRKKLPAQKTYVLIFDFWAAGNYYHWLIDTLPRLWIVKEQLQEKDFILLLPGNAPKFVQATLSYFHTGEVLYIGEKEFISVPKLLVSHYLAGSGHIHPARVLEVKNYLSAQFSLPLVKKLIYVSRGKQKARRVLNEEDVIKCVTSLGFEVVYFEDHDFEAQVSICRNASVMVSSHGANLTNSLFMPQGAKVMELIRNDRPNFCYWALANAVNLNYYYQLCQVTGNDHLVVDIALFKTNLQAILHG